MKQRLDIHILTFSTSFENEELARQICIVVQTILVLLQRIPNCILGNSSLAQLLYRQPNQVRSAKPETVLLQMTAGAWQAYLYMVS